MNENDLDQYQKVTSHLTPKMVGRFQKEKKNQVDRGDCNYSSVTNISFSLALAEIVVSVHVKNGMFMSGNLNLAKHHFKCW